MSEHGGVAEPHLEPTVETVEAVVRRQLATALGGRRGMVEAAVPTITFTILWLTTRELRKTVREAGLETIRDAPDRTVVHLSGTLRTVTLRPRGGVPALEAELFDGSGALTLVWLGRRQITGISPGRQLEVEGRIGVQDGVRVIYNPRYELRA